MRDGMQYGEQGGGIEMERFNTGKLATVFYITSKTNTPVGRNLSIGTIGAVSSRGEYVDNSSSQVSLGYPTRLMSQGRNESGELLHRL